MGSDFTLKRIFAYANTRNAVKKVLFVCTRNSARSQMAEALLNHQCGEFFKAKSAGFVAGTLNPLAVEAMAEVGIDISGNETKSVFDLYRAGELFAYVIGVCDQTTMEKCPTFPAPVERLNWSFRDPASVSGSYHSQMQQMRDVRDLIREGIDEWCSKVCCLETA